MTIIQKILNFFKLSSFENNETDENETVIPMLEQLNNENALNELTQEERINASKKTLMTRLYILEQEIVIFKEEFPKEYGTFLQRINLLRDEYILALDQLSKGLTFEIDPEIDGYKIGEVVKLEKDIKTFIEKEVKFDIISKRLRRLVSKLNILYNVSIFHSKQAEKEKVLLRLKQALEVEEEVVQELKECYYILNDKQLKERTVELISYADYEIFKASIRNSNMQPSDVVKGLTILTQFEEFDYISCFKSFAKDEISDFNEQILLISNNECRSKFVQKLSKLLQDITYCNNEVEEFLNVDFWNTFLNFESNLLEMLKESGVEKEKIKVKLISKMNIGISENEVLTMPITNTYLSLIELFHITHDERILLVIKLLKNISKDVSYKEIYFLLLLFDVTQVIERTPNGLIKYIQKYLNKYPYNEEEIAAKKKSVISSKNKEYVVVFSLDSHEKEIIATLEKLNIDFKIVDSDIYMNAFYFNGLKNVENSLKANTKNIV